MAHGKTQEKHGKIVDNASSYIDPTPIPVNIPEAVIPWPAGWGDCSPRKAHYFRDGETLCGRVAGYVGDLQQTDDGLDDCVFCRNKLEAT